MFWEKQYEPTDIYKNITKMDLDEAANYYHKYGLNVFLKTSDKWAAYGYYQAKQYSLDEVYADSMAAMITTFATEKPITFGTEMYLKEDQIEDIILKEYRKLCEQEWVDEKEKLKNLITYIIKIYNNNSILTYEKAVYRKTTYLTHSENELFEQIPGLNNHEKMQNLLNSYHEYNITEEW